MTTNSLHVVMVKGMSFIDKKVNLLLLVIPLYFTQGGLFPRGSVIPVLCVLIWLLLDAYYVYKTISTRKLLMFEKAILLFGVLSFISYLSSPKIIDTGLEIISTYGELKNILIMMFSYFPFRYAMDHNLISHQYLRRYALLVFIVYTYAYFVKQSEALITMYWKDNVTNNGGYLIPLTIPLVALFMGKKSSYVYLAIGLVLVLTSAKRGAILCSIVELLFFFWYLLFSGKRKKNIQLNQIIIVLISVVSLSLIGYLVYQSNEYLVERILDTKSGDSSGRDTIYEDALNTFQRSVFWNKVAGHGFFQNLHINNVYAHSDWYELLVDYGIVGVFIYSLIFLGLYFWFRKNSKYLQPCYRCMFVSAVSCWLMKSVFSMGFNSPEAAMLTVSLAISMSSKRIVSDAKS